MMDDIQSDVPDLVKEIAHALQAAQQAESCESPDDLFANLDEACDRLLDALNDAKRLAGEAAKLVRAGEK